MGRIRDWYDDRCEDLGWLVIAVILTALAEESQRQYVWPKLKAAAKAAEK